MAKKNARVVVDQKYFELLQQKAAMLDEGFDNADRFDQFAVSKTMFKDYEKIEKEWQKIDFGWGGGSEPYVEPKAAEEPRPVREPKSKKKLVSGFDSPPSRKKK